MKLSKFKLTPQRLSIVAILGLLILGVFYVYGRVSNTGINFQAKAETDSVFTGIPFDVIVTLNNDSDNFLKNAKVSLQLPEGVKFLSGADKVIDSINLDNVRPGEIREEVFNVIAVSQGETVKNFETSISYTVGALSAAFRKNETVRVKIYDFPLSLDVQTPETILSGQNFDFSIKYKNLYSRTLPAFSIKLEGPEMFSVVSMNANDDNVWEVSNLKVGEEGEIKMIGNVESPENLDLRLGLKALLSLGQSRYAVLSKLVSVVISQSPLSMNIIPDDESAAYWPGDRINYSITYRNNTDKTFENPVITAKLSGVMFDFKSLAIPNASFNPSTKTISWTQSTGGLGTILPGGSGSLKFSIKIIDSYSIKRINDKNFTIKIDGKISANPSDELTSKIFGTSFLESKIAGRIEVESFALLRDAPSLMLNSGPWPPKAGQETDFTVHWLLTNFSTDVSNVEIKSSLPDGVIFTGKVKSNIDSVPELNEDTGEIVWKISKIFATTGLISPKPEAVFQIRVMPGNNNIGTYMDILGEASVTARDDFTFLTLSSLANKLTTRLPKDSSVKEGEGIVIR